MATYKGRKGTTRYHATSIGGGGSLQLMAPSTDGSAGQLLSTDGAGNLVWATDDSNSPGGSDTHVQFNDGGSFGGSANLTWDDATLQVTGAATFTGFIARGTTAGITASVTQTQGEQALTSETNEVSTVGTDNDVVTLASASAGRWQSVINNGDNILQIFPASGDNLGQGVDASTALDPGDSVTFEAYDATNWRIQSKPNPSGYGSLSVESNATETTISAASTDFSNKVQVTVFDTDGPSNSEVTPDNTNDHLTVNIAGEYKISMSVSASGGANDVISGAFFVNNGATQVGSRFTRKIGSGGDVGNAGLVAIGTLAANDTVEVWLQNESATTNILVEDALVTVERLG